MANSGLDRERAASTCEKRGRILDNSGLREGSECG